MSDTVVMSQPPGSKQTFGSICRSAARPVADWLCLAATPTFALMALLTAIHRDGMAGILCSAAHDVSPLSGMVAMYLLMSVFHLSPWLTLFSRPGNGVHPASRCHDM